MPLPSPHPQNSSYPPNRPHTVLFSISSRNRQRHLRDHASPPEPSPSNSTYQSGPLVAAWPFPTPIWSGDGYAVALDDSLLFCPSAMRLSSIPTSRCPNLGGTGSRRHPGHAGMRGDRNGCRNRRNGRRRHHSSLGRERRGTPRFNLARWAPSSDWAPFVSSSFFSLVA